MQTHVFLMQTDLFNLLLYYTIGLCSSSQYDMINKQTCLCILDLVVPWEKELIFNLLS